MSKLVGLLSYCCMDCSFHFSSLFWEIGPKLVVSGDFWLEMYVLEGLERVGPREFGLEGARVDVRW
jgi:hypothetical protein